MARPTGRPVREELLVAATELIQEVGVSGFSYNVLAGQLGIKAPSIHHHFKRKQDLVAAVAARYRFACRDNLDAIDATTTVDRLRAYADMFATTAAGDRMCLCGAVASDWASAGELPRLEVEGFFDDQLVWLAAEIARGSDSGELRADLDALGTARLLLAALEGALLLKRAAPSHDPVRTIGDLVVALLSEAVNQ